MAFEAPSRKKHAGDQDSRPQSSETKKAVFGGSQTKRQVGAVNSEERASHLPSELSPPFRISLNWFSICELLGKQRQWHDRCIKLQEAACAPKWKQVMKCNERGKSLVSTCIQLDFDPACLLCWTNTHTTMINEEPCVDRCKAQPLVSYMSDHVSGVGGGATLPYAIKIALQVLIPAVWPIFPVERLRNLSSSRFWHKMEQRKVTSPVWRHWDIHTVSMDPQAPWESCHPP